MTSKPKLTDWELESLRDYYKWGTLKYNDAGELMRHPDTNAAPNGAGWSNDIYVQQIREWRATLIEQKTSKPTCGCGSFVLCPTHAAAVARPASKANTTTPAPEEASGQAHTPGLMRIIENLSLGPSENHRGWDVWCGSTQIGQVYPHTVDGSPEQEANANRVALCWNACANLSAEQVAAIPGLYQMTGMALREREAYEAMREALGAMPYALKLALSTLDHIHAGHPIADVYFESVKEDIRAALAQAEAVVK